MKESRFKSLIRFLFFQAGSIRPIMFGPLAGMIFRVERVTGLSPFYSGTERHHQRVFARLVRSGDVVVDVGANWGVHTLYLSRLVGPKGQVIALEPLPEAFAELVWHAQRNGCENVKPLMLAASDSNGEAPFIPAASSCEGTLAVTAAGTLDRTGSILVTTRTLDALINELDIQRLRLIKIDVEGAEGKVLAGAQQIMASFKPYFVMDLHTPEQDVSVARSLIQHGYKLDRLSGPPILRTDLGWPHREGVWGSILASPPS